MRGARVVLLAVATCAAVAVLGTLLFAAVSRDDPDLGEPVHLEQPTNSEPAEDPPSWPPSEQPTGSDGAPPADHPPRPAGGDDDADDHDDDDEDDDGGLDDDLHDDDDDDDPDD